MLANAIKQEKEIKTTQIKKGEIKLNIYVFDHIWLYKDILRNNKWVNQGHRIKDQNKNMNPISNTGSEELETEISKPI